MIKLKINKLENMINTLISKNKPVLTHIICNEGNGAYYFLNSPNVKFFSKDDLFSVSDIPYTDKIIYINFV